MSHVVMLPSAPCSPLLLFLIVDIILTLVAFIDQFPGLVLAHRVVVSVRKLAAAADRVRARSLRTRTTCLARDEGIYLTGTV